MYGDYVIVLRLFVDHFGKNDHKTQCLMHSTDIFFAVRINPHSCINPCYCAVVVSFFRFCATNVDSEVNCP